MEIKGKARALFPPPQLGCSSYRALCSTLIRSGRRAASDASLPSMVCVQFPGSWRRAGREGRSPPAALSSRELAASHCPCSGQGPASLSPWVHGTTESVTLIHSRDYGTLQKVVICPKIHVSNEEVTFSCLGYSDFARPLQNHYSSTATFSFTPDTAFKFKSRSE